MELFLFCLIIRCLKPVTLQELLNENAQNQQNLPSITSLTQGNENEAVASVSSVGTNAVLSSETLVDIFNAAKNISHSKGIYHQNSEEGMTAGEHEIRRSIQRKVSVSTLSDIMEKVLKHIDKDINKLELLNYLEPLVHEFDIAVNFANLGGIQKVSPLLFSSNDDIASSAAMVLGAAVQSNPTVQNIAVKEKLIPDLLKLSSHKSPVVLSRVIFALASLLRNAPNAQEKFIAEMGVLQLSTVLKNHLIATNTKLKVINLLNDLVVEQISAQLYPSDESSVLIQKLQRLFTTELQEHGVCKLIPSFLDLEDFDNHQKVVDAMLSLHNVCIKDFENEGVVERIKHLIYVYNPESNDDAPFYTAVDMELKIMLYSELKSLFKKVSKNPKYLEYTKDEL